jgi:5-methylcytosine-specific restriction endonuclease McrA
MVFVVDLHQRPLMPCTEKRARLLLERGRAVIHRVFPFTIRLQDRTVGDSTLQPLRLKLDPGSKDTGMALILEGSNGSKVLFFGEIHHKPGIKARLDARRAVRRSRRARHTRYRPTRFLNRRRPDGWLPPSLEARVDQTLHAVARIRQSAHVTALSVEHVRFDTQQMQNPEVSGVEYQQGELAGYEVKEYLLFKFGHKCAYCGGLSKDPVLEVEHMTPRSRGGTDRVSNLAIACHTCNQAKGKRTPEEWADALLRSRKAIDQTCIANCSRVRVQAKTPLKDAAAMNTTRWALLRRLADFGLPIETGSGGLTKFNRTQLGLPKEHYYDALSVGASTPVAFTNMPAYVQQWSALGRGSRQMTGLNATGFPIRHRSRKKGHFGFHTGDFVVAHVPNGKYEGTWCGRLKTRATGRFDIVWHGRKVAQGIDHHHCRAIQRASGWNYEQRAIAR